MKKFCLYLLTPILSFIGGFYAYVRTAEYYWQQEISGGDAISAILAAGLAFVSLMLPMYFWMIEVIDEKCSRYHLLLYPLICMLIFFLPVLLIMAVWGGSSAFAAESLLFYAFFLAAGFIFGVLNWLFKRIWMPSADRFKKTR